MRRHQLIHPAKVQDLQIEPGQPDMDYLAQLNSALHESAMGSKQQRRTIPSKMPTPASQLSYKPLTPKAAPLPPGLGLTRDGHGKSDPARSKVGVSPAYSSRHASRASAFKNITAEGKISRLSTPNSSNQQNGAEPTSDRSQHSTGASNNGKPEQQGSSKKSSPKASPSPKAGPSPARSRHPTTSSQTSKRSAANKSRESNK